ncbi:fasciclin domain-containing protein [Chitinophaga sp. 212800010-3]|uniref:fasciclin domain-containing protein n=1 Tax=unclassified Chitinophaga TaxID=2619133 RepID=UPI002DF1A7C1|nr:hypothetical protein [Chitinophaga sp. 212800010-3]
MKISIYNIRRMLIPVVLAGMLTGTGCKKDKQEVTPDKGADYFSRQRFLISTNYNFILFDTCLKAVSLQDTLTQPGPFTTLIPDNAAIQSARIGAVKDGGDISWLALPTDARRLFANHILRGNYSFRSLPLALNQPLPNLDGKNVYVSKYRTGADTVVTVNGVRVKDTDINTSNGQIQVLSGILTTEIYPSLTDLIVNTPPLTFFALAVQRSGLQNLLTNQGTYTVWAPSNDAFLNSGDPKLNSMQALEKADTAVLAALVRRHILPTRNFLLDMSLQSATLDTLRVQNLQREVVRISFKDRWGRVLQNPLVLGKGNKTAVVMYEMGYQNYIINRPAPNGVLHIIAGLLKP